MKISIITVCFNEEKNIAKTLDSIIKQTSSDIECIVCDGASSDNTVKIAEGYREEFERRGINYIVSSQKDGGVYFGMNIGIDKASGDYILFLNAGDYFFDENVIADVSAFIASQAFPDVVFGDLAYVERGVYEKWISNDNDLMERMSIAHQTVFAAARLMKEKKFNTKYRICADYNFLLELKLEGRSFKHIDRIISFFTAGGISTTNKSVLLKDVMDIQASHGIKSNKSKLFLKEYWSLIAYRLKMAAPEFLWRFWTEKVRHNKIRLKDN